MNRYRKFLAFLLTLLLAFGPAVGAVMAKPCPPSTQQLSDDGMTDCPCSKSMPDCGATLPCPSVAGCSSQCLSSSGILALAVEQNMQESSGYNGHAARQLSSLSIKPPAPPPRG